MHAGHIGAKKGSGKCRKTKILIFSKWPLSSGLSLGHKYKYLFPLGEFPLVVWFTLTKGEIDCMMIETMEEKGFKLL